MHTTEQENLNQHYFSEEPKFPAKIIVFTLFIGAFFGYLNDTLLNVALTKIMESYHCAMADDRIFADYGRVHADYCEPDSMAGNTQNGVNYATDFYRGFTDLCICAEFFCIAVWAYVPSDFGGIFRADFVQWCVSDLSARKTR